MVFVLLASCVAAAYGQVEFRKVNSQGLDIYYRVFGEGHPLLIIGGGPGDNSDRYLSLCELLAKDVQCILVDQRGTGKSMPKLLDASTINVALSLDDFEAVRRSLGLNEWSVLGFSYGGFMASLYANFFPDSITSLVLLDSLGLNTDAFLYFFDNLMSRLCAPDKEQMKSWSDPGRVAQDGHHALVERIRAMMPAYFFDKEKSLLVSGVMKDSDFNFEMGDWIWKDVKKRGLDLAKMPPAFRAQVLILQGRQDPLGESIPQALARYYPDARLLFVEKAGHYSWVEQPEKVLSAIREFLLGAPLYRDGCEGRSFSMTSARTQ